MSRGSAFFKLMGFEGKRIFRNRAVSFLLLTFAAILLLLLTFMQSRDVVYSIAVFPNGEEVENSVIITEIKTVFRSDNIIVESEEEGLDMIRYGKATFLLTFHRGESGTVSAVLYYDESNRFARGLAYDVRAVEQSRSYSKILEIISSGGIYEIDEAVLVPVTISPITKIFEYEQLSFVMEIAVCVALVLMLGLAYSLARDRETDLSKNLSYLPIGKHTYLFAKLIPYFILGMVEMPVVLLLGMFAMHIEFQLNFFLVWLLSSFFVMATLSLGLLLSLMKSQISAVLCDMIAILFPIFVCIFTVVDALPLVSQIFCYAFPIIPFMQLANGMIFNGVIIWWDIAILITESILFYSATYLIFRRNR